MELNTLKSFFPFVQNTKICQKYVKGGKECEFVVLQKVIADRVIHEFIMTFWLMAIRSPLAQYF